MAKLTLRFLISKDFLDRLEGQARRFNKLSLVRVWGQECVQEARVGKIFLRCQCRDRHGSLGNC